MDDDPVTDDHVDQQQRIADLKRFGERTLPEDLAGNSIIDIAAEGLADRNSLFMSQPARSETQPRSYVRVEPLSGDACIELSSGDQPMNSVESWILDSVVSMQEPASIEHNEFETELQQMERELEDPKYLKRVQFTCLTAEAQPLYKSQPDYAHMSLDKQIYLRKIVDKFPTLPSYLAERFAAGSLARKTRLELQCRLNGRPYHLRDEESHR